jgi:transposase-like protein
VTEESGTGSARHLPVFHCPYCGDEELTPYEGETSGWRCGACLRAFSVRLIATGVQE